MTLENHWHNSEAETEEFLRNLAESAELEITTPNLLTLFERPASEIDREQDFSFPFDPKAIERATKFLNQYKNPADTTISMPNGRTDSSLGHESLTQLFDQTSLGKQMNGSQNFYSQNRRSYQIRT